MTVTTLRRKTPSIQVYCTPWRLFRAFQEESFNGEPCGLDACADAYNTKAPRFWSMEHNGLKQLWFPWTYWNPPYAEQRLWIEKAVREWLERGIPSCGLVKLAASERYWRPNVYELAEQHYFDGRIAFDAPRGGLRLKTKHGDRVFAEGESVGGSDFSNALILLGPQFKPRTIRYRNAKTGRLIRSAA